MKMNGKKSEMTLNKKKDDNKMKGGRFKYL